MVWYFGCWFMALVTSIIFQFTQKWRNPSSGSRGFLLTGETLVFFTSKKSLGIHPFIHKWYARMLIIVTLITPCPNSEGQIMPTDVTVAQDGSGNFKTISDAIHFAPSFSTRHYHIRIREGLYAEYVTVGKEKTNRVLVGEGINRTILSGNRSTTEGGLSTYQTATVGIKGTGFVGVNITFQNLAGPTHRQAVALLNEANHSVFYKCSFIGYQDTLYTRLGTHFFRVCEIYGTVDFIFGDATAIFQNSNIYARLPLPSQKNTITAQKKENEQEKTGIIIHNCNITATQDLRQQKSRTFLGRPWGKYSTTVVMQSSLDDTINPQGWAKWVDGQIPDTVYYVEFGNRGLGARTEGRVRWSRVINRTEANRFTVRNFIQGDQWIPAGISYSLDLI